MPPDSARLTITQATPSEAGEILALLQRASERLHSQGIRQWLPGDIPPESVEAGIRNGEVFVAKRAGQIVGTVTLQDADIPGNWRGVPHGDAVYLHRLAVDPAFSGQGIGLRILRWAEGRAASLGKTSIRLDCWAGNETLRRYYERAGYRCRGVTQEHGPSEVWEVRLLEKRFKQTDEPHKGTDPTTV
jgi:predicted N-acetyltransferase YhbS